MNNKIKSRMSPGERQRRRVAVGKSASAKIAKSEQLNFRIEEQAIKDLQDLAYSRGLPVSTMIHDWVLERLAQEKFGEPQIAGKAIQLLGELHGKLQHLFERHPSPTGLRVSENASVFKLSPKTKSAKYLD